MSTVNLITKDVLVANNNTDPISLLRKGIIKRDSLVGAKEFITIPNAPENFAKRIISTVPVTIDGIKVKIGDGKTIETIYATAVDIHAEIAQPIKEEEPEVVEEVVKTNEEIANEPESEELSEGLAQAEAGVDDAEDIIEEDETENEEAVESSNENNSNQNNQFNYKKKRRR